jgi:hypothetical protein
MNLNGLRAATHVDPSCRHHVLVMRHRPKERELRKVFQWLAGERPKLFNAYQSSQVLGAEKKLAHAKYLVSFIVHEAGKALFVGVYKIRGSRPITHVQYWKMKENRELRELGMEGLTERRERCLWFDLRETGLYADWKGKLVIDWSNERAWCRWADSAANDFPVHAIHEENVLISRLPADELVVSWEELQVIPRDWRLALSQWRGVYLIFDRSTGKGYVGAAYGADNIYQRWSDYAASGHGGNKRLRKCRPENLWFSVFTGCVARSR